MEAPVKPPGAALFPPDQRNCPDIFNKIGLPGPLRTIISLAGKKIIIGAEPVVEYEVVLKNKIQIMI